MNGLLNPKSFRIPFFALAICFVVSLGHGMVHWVAHLFVFLPKSLFGWGLELLEWPPPENKWCTPVVATVLVAVKTVDRRNVYA